MKEQGHWITEHTALLTVKELGMKLGVDDEMMSPMLTSEPPAGRACQLWLTTPVKVPEEKPVSCVHKEDGGGGGIGEASQSRDNDVDRQPDS